MKKFIFEAIVKYLTRVFDKNNIVLRSFDFYY